MAITYLSYGSPDKDFVTKVANGLPADSCILDDRTFPPGSAPADEILRKLDTTTLFVLFASKQSVDRPYVVSEVEIAIRKLVSRSVSRLLVIIIDDINKEAIPFFTDMKDLTVLFRSRSLDSITQQILSLQFQIDIEQGITGSRHAAIFVNRDRETTIIRDALALPPAHSPKALFVSGWDGIGRRSLIQRTFSEVMPHLPPMAAPIPLSENDGIEEFFLRLLDRRRHLNPVQWHRELERFRAFDDDDKTDLLIDLLVPSGDEREPVIVLTSAELQKDNGDIVVWLRRLVQRIPSSGYPRLILLSRRAVPQRYRETLLMICFLTLGNLSTDDARAAFSLWLKAYRVDFDLGLVDDLMYYVGGHPKNIEAAARYARDRGVERLRMDKTEFRELFLTRASTLLRQIDLDDLHRLILLSLVEMTLLSAEHLRRVFNSDDVAKLITHLDLLQEYGLIEWDGRYFYVAAHLTDAVSRMSLQRGVGDFRAKLANMIASELEEVGNEVNLATLNAAALLQVRRGGDKGRQLATIVLPSHLIRVGREEYDRRNWSRALELCQQGMKVAGAVALSESAHGEALRLKGLSLARLGRDDEAEAVAVELSRARNSRVGRRHALFLRGFIQRLNGFHDNAVALYTEAQRLSPRNYNILRELAQALLVQERFGEAEQHARQAYDIAPENEYVVDILVSVLIGMNRRYKEVLRNNHEIHLMLEKLQRFVQEGRRDFYNERMGEYCLALGEYDSALKHSHAAIARNPTLSGGYILRSRIMIAMGQQARRDDLARLEKLSREDRRNDFYWRRFVLTKLRFDSALRASLIRDAWQFIQQLQKLDHVPKLVKTVMSEDFAAAVFRSSESTVKMKEWARLWKETKLGKHS